MVLSYLKFKMKKVIVASENPVKIDATKLGFEKMFPDEDFEFIGVSVPSEVGNQPMNNEETFLGAKNRVKNSMKLFDDADYWVGIEGGIDKFDSETIAFAWAIIESKEICGKAKTGTFHLPKRLVELIDSGKELGDANDILFGQKNSKQKGGTIGYLTNNLIDRTKYYSDAIILSLIPFKNSDIYN